MKIDKDKFNKLKQMDRIEYRQKEDMIKEKYQGSGFFSFINWSVMILGFILLLAVSSYSISEELFLSFLKIIYPLSKILIFGVLVMLLCDIVEGLAKKKELLELNEEYFSVEVKK